MRPAGAVLLAVWLLAAPAAAAPEEISAVAASLQRKQTAVTRVSRTIDELRKRRDELRRALKESNRSLQEVTAGWQSMDREAGVQEANLAETERIAAGMSARVVRLAAAGPIPPTAVALLVRELGVSTRALGQLRDGFAGRIGQREAADRERQTLQDGIAEAEAELAEIEEELRSQTQTREKLQRETASLRKVFAGLAAAKAGGAGLAKRLPWPIEGTTARPSGELRGIVILPGEAGTARAVAGGEVAFADAIPGLGTVVVVQHGEYFTVYGNLLSTPLAAKAAVRPGDPVGAVEKGLDAQRGGLYFEVRHHDRALDPLEWLASIPGRGETPR